MHLPNIAEIRHFSDDEIHYDMRNGCERYVAQLSFHPVLTAGISLVQHCATHPLSRSPILRLTRAVTPLSWGGEFLLTIYHLLLFL